MPKYQIFPLILFTVLLSFRGYTQHVQYEVYAIKFAERTQKTAISEIAVGSNSKDSTEVCFMFWLLKGDNGKVILVDAGFSEDTEINPKFISYIARPDKMLENLGIPPGDISDIILTHPHWDHIGGIDLFPGAMVWIQEKDYNYYAGSAWQQDGNNNGFNEKDVLKTVQKNLEGKLKLVQGDNVEILPGIKVYTGSKHTYESQFVKVDTGNGEVIIASDNAWFYYNLTSLLPIPLTMDAKAYAKNLKRMRRMVTDVDFIIPGHDPLVFSKFQRITDNMVRIK